MSLAVQFYQTCFRVFDGDRKWVDDFLYKNIL